jgi:hypothetical protein
MRLIIGLFLTMVLFFSGCAEKEEDMPPSNLHAGEKSMTYNYTLRGESGAVEYTVYRGLYEYLGNISRFVYCRPQCPTNDSIQQKYLDEKYSEAELSGFLDAVKKKGRNREDQAMIAVNLVQNIPYDDAAYEAGKSKDRYPYQVLYDGKAVCGEKVRLLSYLLRGLGYDTSMLYYSKEKHAALGIKCPENYSHKNTGYCFIETTTVAIPTYDTGDYPGMGRITSAPVVLNLSGGDSYDNIAGEWEDAREWQRIEELISRNNRVLKQEDYDSWKELKDKYGIHTGT